MRKKNEKWCWSAQKLNIHIKLHLLCIVNCWGQNHNHFGRSHAVMCYYLNWWFIPNQLNAPQRDSIRRTERTSRKINQRKTILEITVEEIWQTIKRTYVSTFSVIYGKDIKNGAGRHLFARQRMHAKTPRNDWFQSMHEIYGSTKGPIIKIDNSKITYSSQLEAVGLMNALFDL